MSPRQGEVRPGLNRREKKISQPCLLTKVLQTEDEHNALAAAYDNINQNKQHTMTTRATTRREINSISSNKSTIRVSSHVHFAICEVPIQHAPIHNRDILLHKAIHVSLIMTNKQRLPYRFMVLKCVEVLSCLMYILRYTTVSVLKRTCYNNNFYNKNKTQTTTALSWRWYCCLKSTGSYYYFY